VDTTFENVTLQSLAAMDGAVLDALPYGVVGLDSDTIVQTYNATESQSAGLSPGVVVGQPFFDAVAQCMNNFLVAQRFDDEPELDATIPYVLTLRMRPTRVRLRLLAGAGAAQRYILIER